MLLDLMSLGGRAPDAQRILVTVFGETPNRSASAARDEPVAAMATIALLRSSTPLINVISIAPPLSKRCGAPARAERGIRPQVISDCATFIPSDATIQILQQHRVFVGPVM